MVGSGVVKEIREFAADGMLFTYGIYTVNRSKLLPILSIINRKVAQKPVENHNVKYLTNCRSLNMTIDVEVTDIPSF